MAPIIPNIGFGMRARFPLQYLQATAFKSLDNGILRTRVIIITTRTPILER